MFERADLKKNQAFAFHRPSEQPLVDRGGGARTIPMVSPNSGATELINGYTMFAPGTQIQEHFHNCEESILIIEGAGVAMIGGESISVAAGDVTWVKAGVPHYFKNTSTTKTMKIFWTYTRPDATRTIVATGDERPIAAEHARDKQIRA
jgi:quercetin dioxygenase-like cupin family protein